MKETKLIKEIPLASSDNGVLSVATVKEPYGEGSEPVVSIAIWLTKSDDEPDWKVHVPAKNLDQVIEALQEAKKAL
ncbi:hypothetical protein [Hydrogenimonas urashimensis]|uniref:hypothetical protein n=1 Tax=Hydrogenimonas urashimensis TaxID=2740515 RepID=UPI00191605AC|nr:hypothetical protein [Hydrogenimonas urashimensis]